MADANTNIKADIDNLRSVAAQLKSVAQDVEALGPDIKDIHASALKEASTNTVDGGPAPVFSPLLASLAQVTQKVGANVGQLHQNIAGDAEALLKLADQLEGTDHGHGQRITNIDAK